MVFFQELRSFQAPPIFLSNPENREKCWEISALKKNWNSLILAVAFWDAKLEKKILGEIFCGQNLFLIWKRQRTKEKCFPCRQNQKTSCKNKLGKRKGNFERANNSRPKISSHSLFTAFRTQMYPDPFVRWRNWMKLSHMYLKFHCERIVCVLLLLKKRENISCVLAKKQCLWIIAF